MLREETGGLVTTGAKREVIEYKIVRVSDKDGKPPDVAGGHRRQPYVVLVVGEANRSWIARHKGLRVYDDEAFDLLIEGIGDVSRIVVTPNVPTRGRSGSIARRGLSSKAFGARRC